MRLHFLLATLFFTASWALQESEVGVVDWHKPLIGIPQIGFHATAPSFHRIRDRKGKTQSVIISATSSNVLAALNPSNGSVDWRYSFEPEDHILSFQKHGDVVSVLSGTGGANLRTFDALTGHLLLEQHLHDFQYGLLAEPSHLGTAISYVNEANTTSSKNIFVLTNGHTIRNLYSATGGLVWSWTSPDQSSLVVYSKIIVTSSTTYAIGLAKSIKSYTLHVTALSTSTGDVLASANYPSSIENGLEDFITVTRAGQSHLVWLEQGTVKFIPLTPELDTKATYYLKSATYKQILDIGLSDHGLFVGVKPDGSTRAIGLDADGTALKSLWDFPDSVNSDRYTGSHYSGGFDKDGWPYIVRVYWSHVFKTAAVQVFAPHLSDGQGLLAGFTFPFDTNAHGIISHVAVDAANPAEHTVLTRMFLTTSTGAVQLWQQDQRKWTREESLADISAAEFVELPEVKLTAAHTGDEETFPDRLTRQLSDTQNLPQYILKFAKRFATGSYASVSSSPVVANDTVLSRDAFGFKQIIVAATPHGKVFGIDSSNGEILWSRVFGLGWAAEIGGQVIPVKLFVTQTVSDGGNPEVVLVTQRRASNTLVDTVLFHIDALTGNDARKSSSPGGILQGLDIISGPLMEAYMLHTVNKTIMLIDEFLQIYLYPDTSERSATFSKIAPSLHLSLRTGEPGQRRLMGHEIILNTGLSPKFIAHPTWTASLPPSEDILSVIPLSRGPVASFGKVLGNRTTLYKYLNPHLQVVLTVTSTPSTPVCSIYLLDNVKGSIIYHANVPSHNGACDIKATLTENWLVYHYYDEDFTGVGMTKSYRLVSVELYEGASVDDKTQSSDMTSYSNKSLDVTTLVQSYIYPHAITAIATTSTKFGVSTKDIIVANNNHKIQSLPRRALDPRRPKHKPTAEEQEEFLVQYDPILPDDPRRTLSHNYQVAKIRRIVASPALLESTSLVFAYGLDMFLTRVAPSSTFDVLSENFNKAQLVLTITGLAVAIMITKPMVRRKRLRERWYQ